MALGGVLVGVALGAKQLVILGGEGLVHQRALALEALETVLVPVTVLIGQILEKKDGKWKVMQLQILHGLPKYWLQFY